jgi:hypothetical protein
MPYRTAAEPELAFPWFEGLLDRLSSLRIGSAIASD